MLGLRLLIEGKCISEWVEPAGKSNRTFRGEERYINFLTYLVGDKEKELLEIPVGVHSYEFSCHLPKNLPYSVEGEHAIIKYKVDAKLEVPWTLIDLHAKQSFIVNRSDDLSAYSELYSPLRTEEVKKFCWGWCGSRPLLIEIQIPKTGYILGENVNISIDYQNNSNTDVDYTNVSLIKREKFISTDPVNKAITKKSKVVESLTKGVAKNSEVHIDHQLQIPKVLMTSNSLFSQTYQISYELKFFVSTTGCSSSPIIKIPITIYNRDTQAESL